MWFFSTKTQLQCFASHFKLCQCCHSSCWQQTQFWDQIFQLSARNIWGQNILISDQLLAFRHGSKDREHLNSFETVWRNETCIGTVTWLFPFWYKLRSSALKLCVSNKSIQSFKFDITTSYTMHFPRAHLCQDFCPRLSKHLITDTVCVFLSCLWVPLCVYTSIICPVEMSMLECAGSSLQEEVLVRPEGLGMGPSLSWDDTLFIREEWRGSTLSTGGFTDILCLHSSYRETQIKEEELVKKKQ